MRALICLLEPERAVMHFAVGRHFTAPFLKALAAQQCHTKFWFGDGLPDGRPEVTAAFRSRGQRVLGPPCTDARDRLREAACAGAKQLKALLREPVVPRAKSLQRGKTGDVAATCGASLQHACAAWQRARLGFGLSLPRSVATGGDLSRVRAQPW